MVTASQNTPGTNCEVNPLKKLAAAMAVLCLVLTGCTGWMDGSYHSTSPYEDESTQNVQQSVTVSDYVQLRQALEGLVEAGRENGILTGDGVDEDFFQLTMPTVISYVLTRNPIGNYAVEDITYELGTNGGIQAASVSITYNRNHTQIRRMQTRQDMQSALENITVAMTDFDESIVLRVENYSAVDIQQYLQDYADINPRQVMEMPQLTVNTYPDSGSDRVLEVVFTYQTSRDTLRTMKNYVSPVFEAAKMYVGGDTEAGIKYVQLYTFLMERFPCVEQTSITPAYSLLRYGVGDSKAFAQVYAAMCREAGLECLVVSGTCKGEARFWNLISMDGGYAHLDLLACQAEEEYHVCTDGQMTDYVWDYSAYPVCEGRKEPEPPEILQEPEETVPGQTEPIETVPEETVSGETVPEETVSDETEPQETQPEQTQPEETVPEDTQPL